MTNHQASAYQTEAHPYVKSFNGFATFCPRAAQTFLPARRVPPSLQAASLLALARAANSPEVRRVAQPQTTIKNPRTFRRREAD